LGYQGIYEKAKKLAFMAVEYDRKHNYENAFKYYSKAAKLLLNLAEISKNRRLKKRYLDYANKYIRRCYEIKGVSSEKIQVESGLRKRVFSEMREEEKELFELISDLVIREKPNVTWDDVADLEEAKEAIKEAIVFPILRPDWFKGVRRPWKGILLFGPPGCGKTHIARAVANEVNANFLNVDAASIFVKWVGESEKRVRALFEYARYVQPSIIFIDELDAMVSSRGGEGEIGVEHRIKTQFLIEIDGIKAKEDELVTVLGATNLPWVLDAGMRRRFEKRIYIPPPGFEARKKIFEINLRGVELSDDVDVDFLAEVTGFYSGADIALLCREAAMRPIREIKEEELERKDIRLRPLKMSDFEAALKKIRPSITKEEIERYEKWAMEFGSGYYE